MSLADVLLLLWVGLVALLGAYRGLAAQLLSLVGLAAGAVVGSFVAPHLLPEKSVWLPFASLVGAVVGALVMAIVAAPVSEAAHRFLRLRSGLGVADNLGGAVLGGIVALSAAWLVAAVALQQPGLGLRQAVRDSTLLPALLRAIPPTTVLRALDRYDPFPLLPQLAGAPLPEPDPRVLQSPGTRAAAGSVVKIRGTSCGLASQGSGWVVRRALVATNAHVVAGQSDTRVLAPNGQSLRGRVVYVDGRNDVALLRVRRLAAPPLAADREVRLPQRVAVLGYPHDGALTATAATAGPARNVIAPDAYERRVRPRTVVPLRGRVRPGESGGPVVTRRGAVVAMVFGGSRGGDGAYGVPVDFVLRGLAGRLRPVSPGPCVG